MIVYYDVFLLDDQSLMDVRHSERLTLLEKIIHCERGVASLVPRQTIDFRHSLAASALRKAFAQVVVDRGEGLVLKPDEPYIVVGATGRTAPCRCIKLKKEYIGAFGDVGDFALVGAGFHAPRAKTYRIPNLKWTHFYVGCLNNKEEVQRWGHKPVFTVVCAVELPDALLQSFLAFGELTAVPHAENTSTTLVIPPGVQCPAGLTVAFTHPSVVDLRCFSFDKPGNIGFWTPRFPAITKIHTDRDFADVLTFDELQAMAKDAVEKPELADSQENLHWIAKLEGADPRGIAVDAVSQATATTMPTPSPAKMTQTTVTESQSSKAASEASRQSQLVTCTSLPSEAVAAREASISIISISSSSAASEPTNLSKRAQDVSSPEQSFKRPCVSFRSKPTLAKVPTRAPLQTIDVNVSYSDTQSAESQDSQGTVKLAPWPPKQPLQEVIEILSSDAEDDEPTQKIDSQRLSPTALMTVSFQDTPLQRLQCKHVGPRCGFVGKTVMLSTPALLHVAELRSLFREHGVDVPRVIPCVETWWTSQAATGTSATTTQSRVLLVDSVQRSAETKALVARLDAARGELRGTERDCITVYDWRVLKHVSIAEDASVTKKYYDGFQDPWRRWYCGLV